MKVVVITSLDQLELYGFKGGNQLIAEKIVESINRFTRHKAVNVFVPMKHYPLSSLFKSYLANRLYDFSNYDLVVSMKFPSYVLGHDNHVCYFMHRMRQFYDLWRPFYSSSANKPGLLLAKPLIHKLDSHYLKKAKKIFAPSSFLRQGLLADGIESQVLATPPIIEPKASDNYSYLFSPSILNDERKRISLILGAMRFVKSKKARLKISGSGPDAKKLQALAARDKRIEFLGYKNQGEQAALYSNALAVPFVSFKEDYGLVTVEAMLSKKPVITCIDSGGPLDFVEDEVNGFVCKPEPKAISKCLNYLIENPVEARRMGERGYKKVRGLNWQNTVKRILSG